MKSTKFFAIAFAAILVTGITAISCGSRQSAIDRQIAELEQQERLVEAENRLAIARARAELDLANVTTTTPCTILSCPTYFAWGSSAYGPRHQHGEVQHQALLNAQAGVIQMMSRAIEGMTTRYFGGISGSAGVQLRSDTESSIIETIRGVVGNTDPVCVEQSGVNDRGNITVFVGIRVSKQGAADAIAANLANSQHAEVRNRAAEMREEMREHFRRIDGE